MSNYGHGRATQTDSDMLNKQQGCDAAPTITSVGIRERLKRDKDMHLKAIMAITEMETLLDRFNGAAFVMDEIDRIRERQYMP